MKPVETIIKALKTCATPNTRCMDCPYHGVYGGTCGETLMVDAAEALERRNDEKTI